MKRNKLLLTLALALGFTTLTFTSSFADNEKMIFEPQTVAVVASQDVAEEVQVEEEQQEEVDLDKLLQENEQQLKIDEAQAQEAAKKAAQEQSAQSLAGADKLIEIAKSKLGSPYVFGARGPSSFDCSGFTSYVYAQMGISIPRVASSQAYGAKTVSKANLQKGDLVFFNTYGGISHVGIYMGGGNFIHASSYGSGVVINNLNDSYYAPRYVTAARYL